MSNTAPVRRRCVSSSSKRISAEDLAARARRQAATLEALTVAALALLVRMIAV